MYAIVDIAGQQFRVEKGQKIFVHRLDNPEGEMIDFDQVLLIDNEGKISIGEPLVEGAFVEGKVLTHVRGDKVIVFKKKRRKGYQKRNGHRQNFSQVEVLGINEKGLPRKGAKAVLSSEKPEEPKAEATASVKSAPKAAPKAAAKTVKSVTADKEKKPATAKSTAAKTAAPKAAEKKAPAAKKSPGAAKSKSTAKPKATPKKGKAADSAE